MNTRDPLYEEFRAAVLDEYKLLGADPAPALNHIVNISALSFHTSIAFISLLEQDRQIFYAKIGLQLSAIKREVAICSHAINQSDALVILDATQDVRFQDNPLVTEIPHIRFYASTQLRAPSGCTIGTLCIADTEPREQFSETEQKLFLRLADLVLDQLEMRRLQICKGENQSRLERMASTSPDSIICLNALGHINFWSSAAEKMFGRSAREVYGKPFDVLGPEGIRICLHQLGTDEKPNLKGKIFQSPAYHKDGTEFLTELSFTNWQDEGQDVYGVIVRDISNRRSNDLSRYRVAHLDPLTKLPNRTILHNRLTEITALKRPIGVLMLDLDGFKEINDSYGHATGDALLKAVTTRLLTCIRPIDTVARLGGDEFVILLPELGDPTSAKRVADGVVTALTEPFEHDGQTLRLSASVGVAVGPIHGNSADELLSCADLALYQAKKEGRQCCRLFTPALRYQSQRLRACRDDLDRAVERNEFTVFYQPQVRLKDGALVGAEALIRWQHPDRGLLPPAAFLDVLDASRYAAQVGDWVLRTACAQAAEWRNMGAPSFRIGVNLCSAQMLRENLTKVVLEVLSDTGLEASGLELEITENIILNQDTALIKCLRELHSLGVGIAFDDYGTGFASLSLLKGFPLTRLKIDRSFVTGMNASQHDATIVRAILQLGHGFKLAVTAEGIETEHELARLRVKGCQEGQGYLFGKPMSAEVFTMKCGLA